MENQTPTHKTNLAVLPRKASEYRGKTCSLTDK
jgi:hypothetical protein